MLSLGKKKYHLFIDLTAQGKKLSNSDVSRVCWKLSVMFVKVFCKLGTLEITWGIQIAGGGGQERVEGNFFLKKNIGT